MYQHGVVKHGPHYVKALLAWHQMRHASLQQMMRGGQCTSLNWFEPVDIELKVTFLYFLKFWFNFYFCEYKVSRINWKHGQLRIAKKLLNIKITMVSERSVVHGQMHNGPDACYCQIQNIYYCFKIFNLIVDWIIDTKVFNFSFSFSIIFWTIVAVRGPSRRLHRRNFPYNPLNSTDHESPTSLTNRDRELVSVREEWVVPEVRT